MASTSKRQFKHLVIDVDGVLTTGQFLYTAGGKFAKIFGPHDNDGLKLIRPYLKISAVTADRRGFAITKKRVAIDMGLPLSLVGEKNRIAWFKKNYELSKIIFMGDGLYDAPVMARAGYAIAPRNAVAIAKQQADFVTKANSGEGAVFEACLHILEKIFGVKDIFNLL